MAHDWQQIWAVFEEAIARPESERKAFVAATCDGDEKLERAVADMLEAHGEVGTFLDQPLVDLQPGSGPETWPGVGDDGTTASGPALREPIRATPPGDADLESAADFEIGPYAIERQVGRGGMSTVYLARRTDDGPRRQVIVKIVRHGMRRADIVERLRAERKILAGLEHPNIARLYDGGTASDGLPFFVMEYVDGLPIDRYCREHDLAIPQRLDLFRDVCAAVDYAHQNLVIHRDLKPSNILVTHDGVVKLLDFGIAKVLDPEAWALELEPTVTASRMLTPTYASPEQFRGDLLTTASDVYSLGVLLYQLLTGRLPFDFSGLSPSQVERKITDTEPAPPSAATRSPDDDPSTVEASRLWARTLEGDLDAIVLKALRSDPRDRYRSAEELSRELARYADGLPVEARQGTMRYRARKFIWRNRLSLAVMSFIVALSVIGGALLAVQSARATRERDQARLERDQKAAVIQLFEDLLTAGDPLANRGSDLTVRELLTGGGLLRDDRLADQPLVRAQLLHTSGTMLSRLDLLEDAQGQLEEALELRRTALGPDAVDAAATECALASTFRSRGDLAAAEPLARRCVATIRDDPDASSSQLAHALRTLSLVLWAKQNRDPDDAIADEARALIVRSDRLQDNPGNGLQILAALESRAGRYDRAASLLRQALAETEQRFGKKALQREPYLNDLALALRWLGDLEAAEATYDESRQLVLDNYGAEHTEYARLINNIAGVRMARGDYAGAETAYREAQELIEAIVGRDHWRIFFVETNIQEARIQLGHPADAERTLRDGRATWEPRLGADHWLLARVDSLLGAAAAGQGRHAEAERLLTESFQRLIAVGAKHRYQQKALERLAAFLDDRGRSGEIAAWEARLPAGKSPVG